MSAAGHASIQKRYLTWTTFPSLPLYLPRTINTSSSFLIGNDRVWEASQHAFPRDRPKACRLRW